LINVNDFFVFINTICNKDEQGGFSIPQFNSAIPVVTGQFIDRCIKDLRAYQVGQNKNYALIARRERSLFDLIVTSNVSISTLGKGTLPNDWYDTKAINYKYITQNPLSVKTYPVREVGADEFAACNVSQLNVPKKKQAVAAYYNQVLNVLPTDLGQVELIYYKAATAPVWAFTIENNEPVYDSANSVNIPLSPQDNNDLAFMFCQYLGLAIKDEFIEQFAQAEEPKH
jgi:hypothetical protein